MRSLKARLDRLTRAIGFDPRGPLWGGMQPTSMQAVMEGGPIPPGTERLLHAFCLSDAVIDILDGVDSELAAMHRGDGHPRIADEGTIIGRAIEYARSLGLTPPDGRAAELDRPPAADSALERSEPTQGPPVRRSTGGWPIRRPARGTSHRAVWVAGCPSSGD